MLDDFRKLASTEYVPQTVKRMDNDLASSRLGKLFKASHLTQMGGQEK